MDFWPWGRTSGCGDGAAVSPGNTSPWGVRWSFSRTESGSGPPGSTVTVPVPSCTISRPRQRVRLWGPLYPLAVLEDARTGRRWLRVTQLGSGTPDVTSAQAPEPRAHRWGSRGRERGSRSLGDCLEGGSALSPLPSPEASPGLLVHAELCTHVPCCPPHGALRAGPCCTSRNFHCSSFSQPSPKGPMAFSQDDSTLHRSGTLIQEAPAALPEGR